MATHGDIGLSQPAASTITMRLRTVTMDMNSTVTHQEVQTIGGAESSLEVARVMASVPGSTAYGLVVREADPSTGPFAISSIAGPVTMRSSAANALVTVYQSTATDLLARVNQGIGNSTVADRWRVETANSSAADYRAARLVDSSGTGFHGPTNPLPIAVTDSSNAVVKSGDSANNAIRVNVVAGAAGGSTVYSMSIQASWANVAFSTAGHTTNTTVLSSAATTPYVSGFMAASTEAGPIVCGFTAGSTLLYPVLLWADGGVPSVTQAVPQSGFLFKGQADRPLEFRILSGSTGTIYLSVTYKQE